MIKNNRLIDAINFKKIDSTPIWIMRQAGRYLPEYISIRKKESNFINFCKNSELTSIATLQPIKRYDLDAAIIFSDILIMCNELGYPVSFNENVGPVFNKTIKNEKDIKKIPILNISEKLPYISKSIKIVKNELNNKIPLIGFIGSPWTVSTYMIEGGINKTFQSTQEMLYKNPQLLHKILKKLSKNLECLAISQIKAGVDVIAIFDTWGGILEYNNYKQFSLKYIKNIIKKIKEKYNIPIILYTKNIGHSLKQIPFTKCDCIGIDWTINIKVAKKIIKNTAIQGNLNPFVLYGDKNTIIKETIQILKDYNHNTGHIFNLGHGITPKTNPENVSLMINTIREYKYEM